MWPRVWLLAGVISDVPEDGDYFTSSPLAPKKSSIVRQADGGIRAFYNVCPHRGNQIALNDRGSVAQVHLRVSRLAVLHRTVKLELHHR